MSIHRQATIPTDPRRVYQMLADAAALSALSGMSGKAAQAEGEAFAAFDGNVTGRQIPGRPRDLQNLPRPRRRPLTPAIAHHRDSLNHRRQTASYFVCMHQKLSNMAT